jgi:hypothetical protein
MTQEDEARLQELEAARRAAKEAGIPWEQIEERKVSIFMVKGDLPKVLVDLVAVATAVRLGLLQSNRILSLGMAVARQLTGHLQLEGEVMVLDKKDEAIAEELKEFVEQLKGVWEPEENKEEGKEVIQLPASSLEEEKGKGGEVKYVDLGGGK